MDLSVGKDNANHALAPKLINYTVVRLNRLVLSFRGFLLDSNALQHVPIPLRNVDDATVAKGDVLSLPSRAICAWRQSSVLARTAAKQQAREMDYELGAHVDAA
jgi:hypothetical protein